MDAEKMLMDINKQLGTIGANISEIKEDISELKGRDSMQAKALEDAYNKAKARQDSIRDDMQHQIDNLSEQVHTSNSQIRETIKSFGERIEEVENKKEKTIAKWWDKIIDKIVWIFIIGGLVVLLRWLNAPPEVMSQLPH